MKTRLLCIFGLLLAAAGLPRITSAQVALQFRDNTGAILATYPSSGCSGSGCITVIFKEDASQTVTFTPSSNTIVVTASAASGVFYQLVEQDAVATTQRTKLNFLPPMAAVDNSMNNSTDVSTPNCAEGGSHTNGLVPDPGSGADTTEFLRHDCSFAAPLPCHASGASHAPGYVPDTPSSPGFSLFLREDCTWASGPAGGGSATLTGGTGISSVTCVTAACTNLRGTISIVGGTFTTGNAATLTWATTTVAYVCTATLNWNAGTSADPGVGNDVATATGMDISVNTSIAGLTVEVNYSCQP